MTAFIFALVSTLNVPTFGRVVLYEPAAAPAAVVLLVSGDAGWTPEPSAVAVALRDRGALVVGIDLRTLRRGLEQSEECTYPAGDFEELARNVQLHLKLPSYQRPLLVGYQSGAALVYAAMASAPAEAFAGGISLAFCPVFALGIPLCEFRGLATKPAGRRTYRLEPFRRLNVPWVVVQGDDDRVCSADVARTFAAATGSSHFLPVRGAAHRFSPATWGARLDEAYRSLTTATRAAETPHSPIPETSDLSLVEVPAAGESAGNVMAILMSGDGGWAELDKSVSDGLAHAGVPTVGWSSLRYFWSPRTPEHAAADLSRIINRYANAWRKPRVILIGYSFGAEVLPFLINRLPAETRDRIADVLLLGPGLTASFEFHVAEWFGGSRPTAYRTVPEIERLPMPVMCVQGAGERDSACPLLHAPHVTTMTVGDGHHFGGEYGRLVDVILRRRAH